MQSVFTEQGFQSLEALTGKAFSPIRRAAVNKVTSACTAHIAAGFGAPLPPGSLGWCWVAYLLATCAWETGWRFEPVEEGFGKLDPSYFRRYDDMLGNNGRGYTYRGRGYVQITGYDNYVKASVLLNAGRIGSTRVASSPIIDPFLGKGLDLAASPDLALQTAVAAPLLVVGCLEGMYTGRALMDVVRSAADFVEARRVVNGTDRAVEIADIAHQFLSVLNGGGGVGAPSSPYMVEPVATLAGVPKHWGWTNGGYASVRAYAPDYVRPDFGPFGGPLA